MVYCSKTIDRDKTIGDIWAYCSKTIDRDKTIGYTWVYCPKTIDRDKTIRDICVYWIDRFRTIDHVYPFVVSRSIVLEH